MPRGGITSGREVARALRAAYLALHRQTNACIAPDGVTADQFVVLSALADKDGVTQQDLVRRVGSDANTVRAILLLLEGRGVVAREPHPADGRARFVTLTAKGRGGIVAMRPLVVHASSKASDGQAIRGDSILH